MIPTPLSEISMATARQSSTPPTPYIVRDHGVLEGEPSVRNTCISVRSVVLAAREYGGEAGVRTAYPQLEPAAIEAALAYYEKHRGVIDRYIRENLADD
jgi:uncharacterized protein (DUF433 family)